MPVHCSTRQVTLIAVVRGVRRITLKLVACEGLLLSMNTMYRSQHQFSLLYLYALQYTVHCRHAFNFTFGTERVSFSCPLLVSNLGYGLFIGTGHNCDKCLSFDMTLHDSKSVGRKSELQQLLQSNLRRRPWSDPFAGRPFHSCCCCSSLVPLVVQLQMNPNHAMHPTTTARLALAVIPSN